MEEFHLSYKSATLMPSNAELKLMTQLLNLPEMKVKNYKLIKQLGVSLYIENEAKAVPCPNCGKQLINFTKTIDTWSEICP
jgi:hypothetical protein